MSSGAEAQRYGKNPQPNPNRAAAWELCPSQEKFFYLLLPWGRDGYRPYTAVQESALLWTHPTPEERRAPSHDPETEEDSGQLQPKEVAGNQGIWDWGPPQP